MWSCWPGMTFINAVCAHSSKWMPHTRHPATGISQSVKAESSPHHLHLHLQPPQSLPATAWPGSPAAPCALPVPGMRSWLIGIAHGWGSQLEKKEAFDKYIDGFFKTYAPERRDKYWLCSVLRRASRCSLIRQSVFWSQGIDRGGRHISSDAAPLAGRGETPRLPRCVISSHHNNISARPCAPKWIFNGQEVEGGGGGWGWLPCSQSIALLQLRNPAGRCHSYFIPGKDYLSGPWEMYWSVFLFPPAITWQRHLGGKWVSDAWCVCSAMVASSVHWWV